MRRKRTVNSSSSLLLDTLCNALGGVIFIALLVILLVKDAPLFIPSLTPPPDTAPLIETLEQLPNQGQSERRIAEFTKALNALKKAGTQSIPTTQSLPELLAEINLIPKLAETPTQDIPQPTPKTSDNPTIAIEKILTDSRFWENQSNNNGSASVRLARSGSLPENYMAVVFRRDGIHLTPVLSNTSRQAHPPGSYDGCVVSVEGTANYFDFTTSGMAPTTAITRIEQLLQAQPSIKLALFVAPESVKDFRVVRQAILPKFTQGGTQEISWETTISDFRLRLGWGGGQSF